MIYAKHSDALSYLGIHPLLDEALKRITPEFLAQVGSETQHIVGDDLYATRFSYTTIPLEEAFFEGHQKYLDIHIMMEGSERVDIAHPETLTMYEHSGDFYAYHGEAEQTLTLEPGQFLVVFPGDAHQIKVQTGEPAQVSKVVFKIRISD